MPKQTETICVVDDDPTVLRALCRLLRSLGFRSLPFSDAPLFLEFARDHAISVAMIDVWMPDMNGFELQRRLREIAPTTSVIMMTGRDEPGLSNVALSQGAAAFLSKPFTDETFLTAISQHRSQRPPEK
jgi:FixJ family two-component response regulator